MTTPTASALDAPAQPGPLRPAFAGLKETKIVEVALLAYGDPAVIPLWFGEGDLPTPGFINRAAKAALDAGQTFYTWQRGIPELREAIADYTRRLYAIDCGVDRITVTGSGMQAIQVVAQAAVDPGDNVVVLGPVWPNILSVIEMAGATTRMVDLSFTDGAWRLDPERLFAAVDDRTRALFVNSPNNPTGWMMTEEEQAAVMAFCRRRRIWLIADEVYARIVYDRPVAPSFLTCAEPDDPLVVVQSFSKPWAMTGWRIGWITAPAPFAEAVAKIIQINTSGTPAFLQQGAVAAIRDGEPFLAEMVERCRVGREVVLQALQAFPRVRLARPEAAFYAFFGVDGVTDSFAFAARAATEHKVGLAPGIAFGPGGEGYLRLCFASAPDRLRQAVERMAPLLS